MLHRPVIVHGAKCKDRVVDRVGLPGQRRQHRWPIGRPLGIRKALSSRDVAHTQQAIIALFVGDPFLGQLSGQPLAAVEANLDVEGEPGLEPEVHEAELRMEMVVIVMQALAWAHEEFALARRSVGSNFVAEAGFGGAEDADEARGDAVALGEGACVGFLIAAAKGFERSAGGLGQFKGGLANLLGGTLDVGREVFERDAEGKQKAGHASGEGQGPQGAAEAESIEAVKDAVDSRCEAL